jgi:hypothetical protein
MPSQRVALNSIRYLRDIELERTEASRPARAAQCSLRRRIVLTGSVGGTLMASRSRSSPRAPACHGLGLARRRPRPDMPDSVRMAQVSAPHMNRHALSYA